MNNNVNTMMVLEAMLHQAILDYGQACSDNDLNEKAEIREDLEHGLLSEYIRMLGLSVDELLNKTEEYMGR